MATRQGVPLPATYSLRTVCPGALGAIMNTFDVRRRNDLLEMNDEPVRKSERLALGQFGQDALPVDLRLLFVGREDHDDVGNLRRFLRRHDGEARLLRLLPGLTAVVQTDNDLDAALFQIERSACPWLP